MKNSSTLSGNSYVPVIGEMDISQHTFSGTPQGGIISSILANIYLNELDQFIRELTRSFTKGERRNRNPEYRRLSDTNFLTMMDNIMVYKGGWGSEGDTMSDKKRESWFFVR